jgi:hypothetical protein
MRCSPTSSISCSSASGAALYALLRHWGRPGGGVLGLRYVSPARLDMLYRAQLLAGQYLPLILFFDRTLWGGRTRDALAAAALLLVQLLTSYYVAYMTVIALAAAAAVSPSAHASRPRRLVILSVAAAAAFVPFLVSRRT